jgi:hypothetical protein
MSLQTVLAAEAHPAEGQFLIQQQTLNTEKLSNKPRRNSKINGIQNRKAEFRANVNLSKEQCIHVMPPLLQGFQIQLL